MIQPANYDDDIEKLKECDLDDRSDRRAHGLEARSVQEGRRRISARTRFSRPTRRGCRSPSCPKVLPDELKARFCGVHFFNPPRYMHLVELIPTDDHAAGNPRPARNVPDQRRRQGRRAREGHAELHRATASACSSMSRDDREAEKFGLRFDEVDDLTGARLGRAKSATFRTADVVGLDTMAHVIKTMQDNLPDDPFFALYETPAVLAGLVKKGALGQKTGAGFYKKDGKEIKRAGPEDGRRTSTAAARRTNSSAAS